MNYQYPYNNSFNSRKKSDSTYLVKLSRQLAGVLIIILILLLCKYVKSGVTESINSKVKGIISLDYTTEVKTAFTNNAPNINEYVNNFLNKFNINKEFKMDYLPVDGKITSNFGKTLNPKTKKEEIHDGININAKLGTNVKAIYDGTIESVESSKTAGITIVINHNNGFKTTYSNLSETKVNEGEMITKGSVIALSGKSGDGANSHLYFAIQKNNVAVNPLDYLKIK